MQFQQIFKLIVLILLTTSVLSQSNKGDKKQFSKIVWVYVEDPANMDFLQKLCLQNIRTFAEGSFYNVRVVSRENQIDYLNRVSSYKQYFTNQLLDDHIIKKTLLQLSILHQFGGIWIDLPIFFTQNLDWIQTVENQKHINNRIADWEVIMFYYPQWFQKTIKRTEGKIQDIVVQPNYQSWFIASKPDSKLLLDSLYLLKNLTATEKSQLLNYIQSKGLEFQKLIMEPQSLTEWLLSAAIKNKQISLDQNSNKAGLAKQLAINFYKISGINSKQTALYISAESKGHTHLMVKYLTQIPISRYQSKFSYLQKIQSKITNELSSILDPDQPMIEHLHSSVELVCEQETIPFRYIAKTSVIDFYLLQTTDLGKNIPTYDAQYVRNNCDVTYEQVLFNFFLQYVLPLIAIAIYIFTVRKAILVFKPEWGIRRSRRIQY